MRRTPRETWRKHVAAWAASGGTARQFAARIGVNPSTLAHWKWRFAAEPEREPVRGAAFVELSSAVASTVVREEERIEVVCRGGRLVRVPRDFDAATLCRLLETLERC